MNPTVLVVGAGPVGLTMAAELARFGLSVRIIDKSAARTDKSKAIVIWSRSMELIDRMGCGESFLSAGLKAKGANITAGKKHIAHVSLDEVNTPHPYALMIPQSETERLMEAQLNSRNVQVERRTELASFTAGQDKVTATIRNASGTEETIDVQWMIGCDGAHSTVRHGLGMQFEGSTMASDWILADIHLAGLPVAAASEINTYWHAEGVLVLFPISTGRFRIIADVGGKSDGAALRADPTLEEVQKILDVRGPGGVTASAPVWMSAFRINERKVADYRAGRVFLAGDAAHVHSPAGGQGMNTGMQDAFNLAWKLAMVQSERADPRLLDSYSDERSAVGRQVLSDAGRMTKVAIMQGEVEQFIRNHLMSLVFGLTPMAGVMANKLTELSIGYPKSPLTLTGPSIHGGPAAGARAPIVRGNKLFGADSQPKFALCAAESDEASAFVARHADFVEKELRAPFTSGGQWLVRPDGYVGTVAKAGDWDHIERYVQAIAASRVAIGQGS